MTEATAGLAKAGIPLVVVTGRPHGVARRLCSAVGLHPAVIASYHGGLVVDESSDGVLCRLTLPRRTLASVVDLLTARSEGRLDLTLYEALEPVPQSRGLPWAAFRLLAVGPPEDVAAAFGGLRAWMAGSRRRVVPGASSAACAGPSGAGCPADHPVEMAVGHGVRVDRPSPTLIDVRHPLATKDRALAVAARAFGVPMTATLAAGDGPADVSMVRAAGWGVAVGSPSVAPAAVADEVIPRAELAAYLAAVAERHRGL